MADAKDEEDLRRQLSAALGWDPVVVEGVVSAVVSAASEQEVEDVIVSFMGDDPTARGLVTRFRRNRAQSLAANRKGPHAKQARPPPAISAPLGGESSSSSGPTPLHEFQNRGPAGTRQGGAIQARMAKPAKRGKQKGGAVQLESSGQLPKAKEIVRRVVNCLSCGKIYDCREETTDIRMFLDGDGRCTFCGERVPSLYGETVQEIASAGQQGTTSLAKQSEADLMAAELKDRLVDYDRNSASRTNVIDDQSDYFAIESNVWLDDSERKALSDRQAAIEEAEAQRSSRITVAIDLMGRKVVVDDTDMVETSAQAAEASGFNFKSSTAELRDKAAAAADATAAEVPQGGGSALADMSLNSLRNMRIMANPSLNGAPSPLFLPRASEQDGGGDQNPPHKAKKREGKKPGTGKGKAVHGRLQHDDPFAELVSPPQGDLSSARDTEQMTFDICRGPPSHHTAGSQAYAHRREAPVVLMEGVVLMKKWLSLEAQAAVVKQVRDLGVGVGGFYTPSYSTGGSLRLKMMCLGKHWEPRTSHYEDIRSSYDGAAPPGIPGGLLGLVQEAMQEAKATRGAAGQLPDIHPDICLCNFYERSGQLGMHQDRDESHKGLRAGVPVVSFSIGDSAKFLYSRDRDESQAQVVTLESGDVLVFGGPARMLYHGISEVLPWSAPKQLIDLTQMAPGRLNLTFRQL